MNITGFSIKRPAGITMIILFFVVLGLYSYNRIGVELLPAINTPFVTVSVDYPGAGAEEVEKQVIKPLEEGLSSLSKLKKMQASASYGSGDIVLEFDLTANTDLAAMDVSKKVDSIKGRLPAGAKDPLVIKRDINATSIMSLGISSPQSKVETYNLVNDVMKDRLSQVPGVSEVQIFGGRQEEIAVEVDRNKLLSYNISINSVVNKIGSENSTNPAGKLYLDKDYDLRVLGEYKNLADIENIQIPTGDGGTVALKNIAHVTRQIIDVKNMTRLNQEESVGLQIFKQSDASVVAVGDAVNKEIEKLRKDFPEYRIFVASDQAKYVHQSLDNTRMSIFEGIFTTALALLFFLKEWRSMMTVLIAIPTSLIATLFAMYSAGFTFNMMSLMGMALCIGILVDDSIVVLENIHRHRSLLGKDPITAALEGRLEIGTAAVAITLCDVVVFLPIAFMSGMVGQFFRQFGLTVVFATLFSLLISFTLTPMISSRLYKEGKEGKEKKDWSLWQKTDKIGIWFKERYETALLWSLANPKKVVATALVLLMASLTLIPLKVVGAEFMPKTDEGMFTVTVELPLGTPFARTDEAILKMEKYLMTIPEVENVQSRSRDNQGNVNVRLKDKKDRKRTIWQVTDEVRQWGKSQYPPGTVRVSESSMSISGMPGGGGGGGGGGVQIEVLGPDNDKLVEVSQQVVDILNQTTGAKDINTNWRLGQPEIQATIKRDKLKYYNASLADVSKALQTGVSGSLAGEFVDQGKDIDINVRFKDGDKIKPTELKTVPVYTGGQAIALGNLVDFKEGVGPRTIRRVDKQRAINVTCNLTDRSLQDFISEVDQKIRAKGIDPMYTIRFAGQAQSMNDTFSEMFAALALAITLVYMVLVVLYESFLTPFIRMFSLPLGFIGALVALALTHNNLNLFSMMGIIMMDGLVAKNGTLLLDYTLTLIDRGKTVREAIIEAGKTRLRPIMMTSITMICGMLPTGLAISEGAENRVGMAWVLIGGLITSTFFTLVIIPIVFLTLNSWKEKLARRKGRRIPFTGRNENKQS